MTISSCCRRMLKQYSDQHRAVLCKNWILPLRVVVLISLFGHLAWRAIHSADFTTIFLVIIHCGIALLLLAECRRSERYHRLVEEFERREAVLKNTGA